MAVVGYMPMYCLLCRLMKKPAVTRTGSPLQHQRQQLRASPPLPLQLPPHPAQPPPDLQGGSLGKALLGQAAPQRQRIPPRPLPRAPPKAARRPSLPALSRSLTAWWMSPCVTRVRNLVKRLTWLTLCLRPWTQTSPSPSLLSYLMGEWSE